ncbi:MAG TPA: PA domain-containing protein [Actinomycetes bacterium]|nr:PA domain-containing protein [Actinomycetes bacterium]
MRRRTASLLALLVMLAAVTLLGASPAGAQHGPEDGHIYADPALDTDGDGDWGKIEFVSQVTVHDAEPELIADVTAFGNYAYLARFGGADCAGPEGGGPDGGVYVIDISDPANPREVGFIRTHQDTLVGEGMQVVHVTTPEFTGDVLVLNHEGCGKNYKAGVSLWDVTDPLHPRKLSEHFGDFTVDDQPNRPHDANQTHSAFLWDAGDKAYLVATDDEEVTDVDIFDVTDPKKPVLIGEFNLNELDISQPELGLVDSFLHDMVVKQIGGRFIMLLSYWDGGYVLLDVTDPANPVFLGDSEFNNPDPELLEQAGVALTPEGNAHQAEFTADSRFVIGTDEDFAPYRLAVSTDDGGEFRASIGTNTTVEEATGIEGTTVFVGRACPGDPAVPPAPDLPGDEIAVVERGVCLFTEKVAAVLAAGGYEAVVIMNREGPDACTGVFTPDVEGDIPTILVGRDAGFALFDQPFDLAACLDDTPEQSTIPIGTVGDQITGVEAVFDGWGYVHLFGVTIGATSATLTELDTFAIPEAMDPDFAEGFGDLSVHEVATDPTDPDLAYLSYYAGGLRALRIVDGELVEVGGYIDPVGGVTEAGGNNFWGVEVWTHPETGEEYILASDRDSGLWIFQDP